MSFIVPAVLPSSYKDLEEKLALFASIPSVSRVQIDVVDEHFASPVSWPYSAPEELQTLVERSQVLPTLDRIEYEIDLMCLDAEQAADAWLALGAKRLTFHVESSVDLARFLAAARNQYGHFVSLGLALTIATDSALLDPHLDKIDYVQFMGIVQIGRQGQSFDPRVLEKIRIFHTRHPEVPIQVDGGVTLENAKHLLELGVSNLVVGSGILRASDPVAAFAAFQELQTPSGV